MSTSPSSGLARALVLPAVLARLLLHTDWPDLHAILNTCTDTRRLFSVPALRDIILARFVPGYQASRVPAVTPHNLVSIEIIHLHLFLFSQSFPVHLYPKNALRALFSLVPYDDESEPLAALTQAHSRFYLLLQSLVHSSPNLLIPPEPSHARLFDKLSPSLPELTFPAPLSYQPYTPIAQRPASCSNSLSKSRPKLLSNSTRRLTLFKFRPTPPPAPVAEPRAMKAYGSSWQRSAPFRYSSETFSHSNSESDLVPPHRHYVTSTPTSTSNSNSQSSVSRSSTPPTSDSSPSPPPSRTRYPFSPLSTPTAHDFIHATSPARAPILRVYSPCASPTIHPQTIIRCEEQLINAGLWSHLSVGDIVINLGHVPLSSEEDMGRFDRRCSKICSSPPTTNFLLFDGTFLVHFTADPGAPVPIANALSLPSPFYYTHILPRLANPVFSLRYMPAFTVGPLQNPKSEEVPMRLIHLPTRVPTVHGSRVALVKRHKWLAQVFVNAHAPVSGSGGETEPELGVGWQGEWILEGDGTREGRDMLLDWLMGRGSSLRRKEKVEDEVEWEWELVRERCRKGRIWLRLLDVHAVEGGSETITGADRMEL